MKQDMQWHCIVHDSKKCSEHMSGVRPLIQQQFHGHHQPCSFDMERVSFFQTFNVDKLSIRYQNSETHQEYLQLLIYPSPPLPYATGVVTVLAIMFDREDLRRPRRQYTLLSTS